jgi:hypothetical protein
MLIDVRRKIDFFQKLRHFHLDYGPSSTTTTANRQTMNNNNNNQKLLGYLRPTQATGFVIFIGKYFLIDFV